ncbi:MAG: hypothetical protein MJ053_00120 [Elusimicrobiaceae bacterium]|nr:hypothetical protein [Elusimicrobiaceae bacterium]
MKYKNKLNTVLESGFQPSTTTKERVRMVLERKLTCHAPRRFQWALAVGSLLVLLGIGLYVRQPHPVELLGPSALHATNIYVAQNFGECGPRGLESQPDYIHFQ